MWMEILGRVISVPAGAMHFAARGLHLIEHTATLAGEQLCGGLELVRLSLSSRCD
jgi:hypothetical protein